MMLSKFDNTSVNHWQIIKSQMSNLRQISLTRPKRSLQLGILKGFSKHIIRRSRIFWLTTDTDNNILQNN